MAPKKRFKDSPKKTFGTCHIEHHYQWSTLAADRHAKRRIVHQFVSTFEDSRRANLIEKRRRRKIQGVSAAIPDQTRPAGFTCPASVLSAISMAAVDVDSLLHKFSFAKASQEEEYIFQSLYLIYNSIGAKKPRLYNL